jgi:hypothetical protein
VIDLNIFHEDGLDFIMYYECVSNGPFLNIEVDIHCKQLQVEL